MKVYTFVRERKNQISSVGVVLTGDHDKIYMQKVFEVESNKFEASLLGIKRALLFVDNNKPLYCKENAMIYSNLNQYNDNLNLENRIFRDEYIEKFKKKRNQSIELNHKQTEGVDQEYMNLAETLVHVHERQQFALSLSNQER